MALEATIVEKLHELRKWQMDQQEQLLKHQQEQRDILSKEQKQLFEVLSQSMQDESLDENSIHELLECNSTRDSLFFPPTANGSPDIPLLTETDNLSLKIPELKLKKTQKSSDFIQEDMNFKNNVHSSISVEGVTPFPSEQNKRWSVSIDDIPVPSPKKDFQTLLEETLQNSQGDTLREVQNKSVIKRPFLKKGEGLARFQPSTTPKKVNKLKEKSALSNSPLNNSMKHSKTNQEKSKTTPKTASKPPLKITNTRRSLHNLPSTQKRLSLHNVPPPKKKVRSKSMDSMPTLPVPVAKKIDISHSDPNSSDLEVKTKREIEEVRIFEFLEEKAENSSFCSTSSTVVAFMQSTPLKTKLLMHKALQQRKQQTHEDSEDQDFEEIVRTTKSNMVPAIKPADVPKPISTWDSNAQLQTHSEKSNGVILPFGTDVDPEPEEDIKYSKEIKNHVSNHVRFAEFNEYKTISHNSSFMTDISNISMMSRNGMNYADEKGAWSDCSATTDSDVESHVPKLKIIQNDDYEQIQEIDDDTDQDFKDENSADETVLNESFNYTSDLQEESFTPISAEKAIETSPNEKIFKPEHLKSRLLELENEIEIFRKETAAVVIQRKKLEAEQSKLQSERLNLQKTFKDKREALAAEQKRAENNLLEEKKRLSREKAALENRLKEAWDKAQKNKLDRQDNQALREKINRLTEEFSQKESKWLAAQARQKSQIRVLQTENTKLKEEIEILKKKNTRIKKPLTNTKAIHQIGKILADRRKTPLVNEVEENGSDEEFKKFVMNDIHLISNVQDPSTKTINETKSIEKSIKNPETLARNRNLYENLLQDATKSLDNVSIHEEIEENHKNEEDKFKPTSIEESLHNEEINNVKFNNINNKVSPQETETRLSIDDIRRKSIENSKSINGNKQHRKEVHHEDGHIEYWYPNGNVKKVFPDTGLSKIIYYNGDVRQTDKEGNIKYYYASTNTWQTTMPDGLEITEFPDGQVERRMKNGFVEVDFPDGSVKIVESDGSVKWALPDGTTAETFMDGEKVLTLPNGQREVHTKEHKRREYPDGTVKLLYPDGSQETRYANGRVRLRDKDGTLLLDKHH